MERPALPAGPSDSDGSAHSRYSHAIVVVYGAGSCGVAPVPTIVVAVFRRALELRFGNAGTVAAKPGVVFQRLPRQGIMIIADAEKAAKAEDGVGNPAAHLVDHDALDRPDLGIVGAIYGRAFHLIAADKGTCFSCFHRHCCVSLGWKNEQQAAQGIVPATKSLRRSVPCSVSCGARQFRKPITRCAGAASAPVPNQRKQCESPLVTALVLFGVFLIIGLIAKVAIGMW